MFNCYVSIMLYNVYYYVVGSYTIIVERTVSDVSICIADEMLRAKMSA